MNWKYSASSNEKSKTAIGFRAMLACLVFAAGSSAALAQTAPLYLVSTATQLATPANFGGPNGNIATDKFGNLFVPDAAESEVLEFPANGGPYIVIFNAQATAPQVSGVAVDSNNNLYVTTRYDGSVSATESDIFKFPYTSSGYPAPYTYTGASPGACTATSTGVCAYGNYLQTAGYYYQPQAIGYDGAGNGYMITTYDSLNKAGGLTIFACDIQCGYDNDSATLAVAKLPTAATSLAVASNGDLYWADQKDIYYSAAGSGKATIFDTSLESQYGGAQGVSFDRAGNLYGSNGLGTYEYPLSGGVIKAANKFEVSSQYVFTGSAIGSNGDVFSANYSQVFDTHLYNFNFGTQAVGTVSTTVQTFTITFLSGGTIATLTAQQAGGADVEFPFSAGTCVAGAAIGAGGTCTFTAGFAPTAVGTRRATVTLTDTANHQVATYLVGVGQGTGVSVDPGTPTAITSTLKAPSGLAVDSTGNVFVADATAKAVYEYAGGAGNPISIGSGYTKPIAVATDGGGNLYVLDQGAGTVVEYANTGGSYSVVAQPIASGLTAPTDIVVGGGGALYVSNTGANTVLQYPNASRLGSQTQSLALGIGLSAPTGLALDPSGNLYVADTGNNRTVQLSFSGAQTAFGTGLLAPTGVAAEASGGVLIADQGNGRVVRVPNEAGVLTTADQVTISQPLLDPYSLRLTPNGNLYISDNTTGQIDSLQRTAGTLNFGISNVNTPTAPQTIVVSSTGTMALTLNSPFFTAPPANSNFTLTTGGGTTGCSSGTLASGTDCTLTSVFTPTSTGQKTYKEALNTTAANAASPSITLTGQGVQLVGVNVTLTQTSPTGTVTYGVPVTLSATVASSSSSSTAVPAGTVTFNVDGSNTKPVTLMNGTASITLTGLGGNTKHTVIATYNGGPVYASGSSTAYTFVVQPATIAVSGIVYVDATTPPSSAPGNPVSFSLILTPSVYVSGGLTGTVNFYNGNTLVGSGMIQQTAQANGTVVYTAGFTTSTLAPSCLAGQTLPNCSNIYHIYASFAGNGNYAGFTTNAVAIIVTVPTYSVTASSTTITSTASQPGTAALAVTSYSTFQGAVALSCSGLPANAYCVFRPGLISLTYVPVFPATVPAMSNIPVQNTTMEILVSEDPVTIKSLSSFGLLGLFASLGLFLVGFRRKGTRGAVAFCVVGMLGGMMLGSLSGCGASSSSSAYPTPPGTYAITLMATATPLGSGGQPPSVLDITKVSSAGTTVTLDASTTTGYTVGELVSVAGVSNAAYDGNFNLTSVKTITVQPVGGVGQPTYYDEITYSLPTAMTGTGTGGTVRPGNLTFTYPFTLVVK
jgi:hypothetical protein